MSPVIYLPVCAGAPLIAFSHAVSDLTFERKLVIGVGAILAIGRRAVTNVVWTMGELPTGDSRRIAASSAGLRGIC